MITRLTVSFTPEERQALQAMAETDIRPPKEQVRWLLRQEAKRRGLLSSLETQRAKMQAQGAAL
jgi:hypothetical protein